MELPSKKHKNQKNHKNHKNQKNHKKTEKKRKIVFFYNLVITTFFKLKFR